MFTLLANPTMQITRRSSASWPDIVFAIAVVTAIALSAVAILKASGEVPRWPLDQSFVTSANLSISRARGHWEFHYPFLQWSGGITSSIIVGLYKLIVPTSASNLNWHIRIFAMITYFISTALLIVSVTKSQGARLLILLLVATSGFQFVQPSSEIFAGSLLTLYLVSVHRGWAVPISALFLVGFGLGKVEFGLAAVAISIYWWFSSLHQGKGRSRYLVLIWTLVWFAVFLLPGFAVNGIDAVAGNRSFAAFAQHYSSLFQYHQFETLYAHPFDAGLTIVNKMYPEAKNVADIILQHPRQYADFLALSLLQSVLNILYALRFLLIPVLIVATQSRSWGELRFPIVALALAMFFTLVPAWLLAFVRIRYIAKLYPAIACLAVAGSLSIVRSPKRQRLLIWIPVILTIIGQLMGIRSMWFNSHSL